MLKPEQALAQMLSQITEPLKTERLPLEHATNRICAEDIISPINVPNFNNSAMDGYAVRLADLAQSMTLSIAGRSFAGQPFIGEWQPQSAVRIMTGSLIPQGADAVIMQEEVTLNQDGTVTFSQLPKVGQNIRYIGEDLKQGECVLKKGAELNTVSLPLLASLGINQVLVYRPLKVAILSTGNELVSVGNSLQNGQIYDSNRFTVKLMLEKLHCEIIDFGIIPDDEQQFEQVFIQAQQQADLIISSGGVSVGEADFTKTVLEKIGKINFWKIAIKPGKPFAFGRIEKAWFCGLPGNPVSALVTFYQLVHPFIERLKGKKNLEKRPHFSAIAQTELKKAPGRVDFQRGFYQISPQGNIEVVPVGFQGSHLFSAFVKSNCFIILEQERGNVNAGEIVTIEPFNHLLGQ
ncbi:molybdopterin molybdotransferase MoeA [Rodentibacter caecimuris]|uniref:Molybdopterin molybdenumtransferase n=1 Tax=Rodentibacter caecimuris TaxID=1796644 RepID=A0ABX3KY88_9PAST|nr:molybdopterin molybdenumtransferase MoeA [Rodentibacter heylii]